MQMSILFGDVGPRLCDEFQLELELRRGSVRKMSLATPSFVHPQAPSGALFPGDLPESSPLGLVEFALFVIDVPAGAGWTVPSCWPDWRDPGQADSS